ncbi:MAG TPA: type I glutamate--ammonia ligase [Firmicutes bacterium]|nr:type I glutamate--ammonia ligase [Bacillota bacterium]
MDTYTAEDVIARARELDVKFIRLQFTDIFGILKNVAITIERLEDALADGVSFDGSSIEGFVRVEESDMLLRPDPSTFTVFPWRPRDGAVARLICDVYNPDGTPFEGCPRRALKRALGAARELGYELNVGVESEFFLFHTDENGQPTTHTHDRGSYFDLSPVDLGENARRDMVLVMDEMGMHVEASHHEASPGQHEITLRRAEALRAADNIVTMRYVVRSIAQRHGLYASFMAKPLFGTNGSGLHLSYSLFCGERNVFTDPNAPHELSETALHFIGGLIAHGRALTAVTSPTVNSYKRLVPGFEAPTHTAWAFRNRSPMVRIPVQRGGGTRIELRSPDPTCNPYLALACSIRAGLDGIQSKLVPPDPVEGNIFNIDPQELERRGIKRLPLCLGEALDELARDEVLKDALGPHIYAKYMQAKRVEWETYSRFIHKWELDEYLARF